jgi:hypothetical protein
MGVRRGFMFRAALAACLMPAVPGVGSEPARAQSDTGIPECLSRADETATAAHMDDEHRQRLKDFCNLKYIGCEFSRPAIVAHEVSTEEYNRVVRACVLEGIEKRHSGEHGSDLMRSRCLDFDAAADKVIPACSALIKANDGTPEELSSYFLHRGQALIRGRKQWDDGLADLTQAIKFDPKNALAFADRGIVWSYKKQNNIALGDFDRGVELSVGDTEVHAVALYYRGLFKKNKLGLADGDDDIAAARALDPTIDK